MTSLFIFYWSISLVELQFCLFFWYSGIFHELLKCSFLISFLLSKTGRAQITVDTRYKHEFVIWMFARNKHTSFGWWPFQKAWNLCTFELVRECWSKYLSIVWKRKCSIYLTAMHFHVYVKRSLWLSFSHFKKHFFENDKYDDEYDSDVNRKKARKENDFISFLLCIASSWFSYRTRDGDHAWVYCTHRRTYADFQKTNFQPIWWLQLEHC